MDVVVRRWIFVANMYITTRASIAKVFLHSLFYPSSIHLYIFLSVVYSPRTLSISLSIQIHGYIIQTRFLHLTLFFLYSLIFVSISCLSTSISLNLCQSKLTTISLEPVFFISLHSLYTHQYDDYLFLYLCQSKFTTIFFKPVSLISYYILCIPNNMMTFSFYLFVNPNS